MNLKIGDKVFIYGDWELIYTIMKISDGIAYLEDKFLNLQQTVSIDRLVLLNAENVNKYVNNAEQKKTANFNDKFNTEFDDEVIQFTDENIQHGDTSNTDFYGNPMDDADEELPKWLKPVEEEKIDIRELAYTLTEEDVKQSIKQAELEETFGIYDVYGSEEPKRSFYASVRTISKEEQAREIYKAKLRAKLGIQTIYDAAHNNVDSYKPSMYSSIQKYEEEKSKAHLFITMNKSVPKDMEQRLIAARIELENLGLIERFNG